MHLVFATSIVPDGAPTTGYEIANAAIVDALRRAGARVTVLGFTWPGKSAADPSNAVVLGSLDVRTEHASALRKAWWLIKAITLGLTVSSAKLRIVRKQKVRKALSEIEPFDAFVLNGVQFAGAFEDLFEDKPYIFVAHNVEYRSAEQSAATVSSQLWQLLYEREARLLRALEARMCDRARFVFTLAEDDRQELGVANDARSATLALVTRPRAPVSIGPRTITCDAALIGTWTWQPNRVGLEWFLDKVVPRLGPLFTVKIAGHIPADLKTPPPGVEIVGRVPDAVEFVRSAAVIPLISRAGTGVQLKTLETFELGLPSVATTSSVRGIGQIPENCTVTDDPVEFARALQAAVHNRIPDMDGSRFHMAQLEMLDRGIRRGLLALGLARQGACA